MKLAVLATCAAACAVAAQAECSRDENCDAAYYCAAPLGLCVPCVDCAHYGRAPAQRDLCARAVGECGACLPGYIKNGSVSCPEGPEGADGSRAAAPSAPAPASLPLYVWLPIAAGILLALALVTVVLVQRFRCNTKLFSSIGYSGGVPTEDAESRPAAPPPYNPTFTPSSPPGLLDSPRDNYPVQYGGPARGESGIQTTVPWNTPHYVKPPTYDEALSIDSGEGGAGGGGGALDDNDNTVESAWTPDPAPSVQAAPSLSEQLREARVRTVVRPADTPPAKMSRRGQEIEARRSLDEPSASTTLALSSPAPLQLSAFPIGRTHSGAELPSPPSPSPPPTPPRTPPPHRQGINNITINFQVNNNL